MRDVIARKIAYWLPKRVVYWALIRAGSSGVIKHDEEVPAVPFTEVLSRYAILLPER